MTVFIGLNLFCLTENKLLNINLNISANCHAY